MLVCLCFKPLQICASAAEAFEIFSRRGEGFGRDLRICERDTKQAGGAMPLSREKEVAEARPDTEVILARGCNKMQLTELQSRLADASTTAPSEEEACKQVGEMPVFGSLIEFTTDQGVATRFATGGYIVVVKIARRYLTKGSVSEGGWICKSAAPFEVIHVQKGRSFM